MVYVSYVNRPNVLLIITDQHRADHLGCYGNRQVRTPHLDWLAARGQRFERCYVANPICMPNRATLLTGRMPSVNGVRHNGVPLPLESVTFAEVMRRAGYRTALIGKAHLQSQSRREVPDPLLFASMRPNAQSREHWSTAMPDVTDDLRYLAERGLRPGATARVAAVDELAGVITLEVGGADCTLALATAGEIDVRA